MEHELDTSVEHKAITGSYKLLKTIGEGNHAKVKLAIHIPTQTEVAVKIMKAKGSSDRHKMLLREINCMKVLEHPNIVQLFEIIDTRDSCCIVMEYLSGGSLMDHLDSCGWLNEDEARRIFRQVISAVQYCHRQGIAHRDLKPENILLDSRKNPKISDFGFSIQFGDDKLSTNCGSPYYAAPELYLDKEYEGPSIDVWSLGVTLYRMVSGTYPFCAEDWPELIDQVLSGKYITPFFFSNELSNFIKKMIVVNPEERAKLIDLMTHPWLTKDQNKELKPYIEPPINDIDPWVKGELENLGFKWGQIQDVVNKKTFNQITAAYRILNTKNAEFQRRVIKVKPFHPADHSPVPAPEVHPGLSSFQQGEQRPNEHKLEERTRDSAAPSARPKTKSPRFKLCWRTPSLRSGPQSSPGSANQSPGSNRTPEDISNPPEETRHRWRLGPGRWCNCLRNLCAWVTKKRLSKHNKVMPA